MPKQRLRPLWDRYFEIETRVRELQATGPYSVELERLEQKRDALHEEIRHLAAKKLQRYKRRLNKLRAEQDRKVKREGVAV